MEDKLFVNEKVNKYLKDNFILIDLVIDNPRKFSGNISPSPNHGNQNESLTNKNEELEIAKFKSNAVPFIAAIDKNGEITDKIVGYISNPDDFLTFLLKAKKSWQDLKIRYYSAFDI